MLITSLSKLKLLFSEKYSHLGKELSTTLSFLDKEKQPQSNVLPSISKANATVVDVKTNTKPKASIPNIFDDQDDDEDLFSVSTSTAAKSVTKAKGFYL